MTRDERLHRVREDLEQIVPRLNDTLGRMGDQLEGWTRADEIDPVPYILVDRRPFVWNTR